MVEVKEKFLCYHCDDECAADAVFADEKYFCCNGCKLVFEILQENNLCSYYNLNENRGIKSCSFSGNRFSFPDETTIQQKLISFKNKNFK